jgi:hypothetical protein
LAERKRLLEEEKGQKTGLNRSKSSNLNVGHSFVKKNTLEQTAILEMETT